MRTPILATIASCAVHALALGQCAFEPGYGAGEGVAYTSSTGSLDQVEFYDATARPDGSVLACGKWSWNGGVLCRLMPDGQPDMAYHEQGKWIEEHPGWVLQEGKALVDLGADSVLYVSMVDTNGFHGMLIRRLNSAGEPDATFGTGGEVWNDEWPGPFGDIYDGVEQADGRVLLAGKTGSELVVMRLMPNGAVDTTFADHGGFTFGLDNIWAEAHAVDIAPDGSLIVTGEAFTDWAANRMIVLRLDANGTHDTTFNNGVGYFYAPEEVDGLEVTRGTDILFNSDGSFLVSGAIFPAGGGPDKPALLQFTADGTLDVGFGTGGVVSQVLPPVTSQRNAMAMRRLWDGRVLMIGKTYTEFFFVIVNEQGQVDPSFGDQGLLLCPIPGSFDWTSDHEIGDITIAPSGKTFIVGSFYAGFSYGYVAALDGLLVGLEERDRPEFVLSPTLASDVIIITSAQLLPSSFDVLDAEGRVVSTWTPTRGTTSASFAVHALAPGAYLLRAADGRSALAERFVVVR